MQDVSHMHPACLWTIACVLAVHVLRNEHGEVIIDNHWVPTSRNTHRQCKQCHTTSINKRQVHLRERNLHQLEGEVLPCPPWSGPREVAQWRRLHQLPLLAGQTGHLCCLPSASTTQQVVHPLSEWLLQLSAGIFLRQKFEMCQHAAWNEKKKPSFFQIPNGRGWGGIYHVTLQTVRWLHQLIHFSSFSTGYTLL